MNNLLKITYDNDLVLNIPKLENLNQQISANIGQVFFIKSHNSDIRKEMGALKAMSIYLKNNGFSLKEKTFMDVMAGCGFSGRIFNKYLFPEKIILNDLDSTCVSILRENYTDKEITNQNIFDIDFQGIIPFIDFNNFTIKKSLFWESVFAHIKTDWALYTDSACYGFGMGNLKSYGVETEIEYYEKCVNPFISKYGFYVQAICNFGHASVILITKTKLSKIDIIPTLNITWKTEEIKTSIFWELL